MSRVLLPGTRVTGKINNITDLGIFVTLPKVGTGLVHRSDFGDWPSEKENYQVNDELRVVVISNRNHKIGLSLSKVGDAELKDPQNKFAEVPDAEFAEVLAEQIEKAKQFLEQNKKTMDDQ